MYASKVFSFLVKLKSTCCDEVNLLMDLFKPPLEGALTSKLFSLVILLRKKNVVCTIEFIIKLLCIKIITCEWANDLSNDSLSWFW